MNLNTKHMGNMIYQDSSRTEEEEDDLVEGVSRSMLEAETFSGEEEEEEDLSSCSLSSMCSSDLTEEEDDASSSSSNGPLEDLSDLMLHLPIKRGGLSKFYEGKSQSFTSLANVKSLEDLMKRGFKNTTNKARRKACKSTGGIIEQSYKSVYSPKATISKKATRTPSSVLSSLGRRRL